MSPKGRNTGLAGVGGPEARKGRARKEMAMKLINLTPHEVALRDSAESSPWLVIPSEGAARAAEFRDHFDNVDTDDGHAIRVNRLSLGEVTGLPDPIHGVGYIVSRVIAEALPLRHDLYIVDQTVRDAQGRIVGCAALAQVSIPR